MATNVLWAHLLRKDATSSSSSSSSTDKAFQIPPIAPQDKTSTTMRMLLHDTQANLETFSARLDGLLQRVDDCRAQVVNATKLLDAERDRLLAEVLEMANRCQAEMKAHVGAPAQAGVLAHVQATQASTDRSVMALEKRIDALQTLFQTQAHALQSIQDQQHMLMSTLLPLVPVVHDVPLQMEQIKTTLSDMVTNAVTTMTKSVESVRTTLVAQGHARSSARMGSSSRRGRSSMLGPSELGVLPTSPSDSRGQGGSRLGVKRARTDLTENTPLPRKLSRLAVPLTDPAQTPRRPLADLLFFPDGHPSLSRQRVESTTPRGYMRPLGAIAGPSTSISLPPCEALGDSAPELQEPTEHSADIPLDIASTNAARSCDQDDPSRAIKIEDALEPNWSGVISIHSSPLSSPPSSARLATEGQSRDVGLQDNISQGALVPIAPHPTGSPPKSMSLRDRRAQMSMFGRQETRRFIPLVPWSDEEE